MDQVKPESETGLAGVASEPLHGSQEEMAGLFKAVRETWSFQLHVSRSRNMLVPRFE